MLLIVACNTPDSLDSYTATGNATCNSFPWETGNDEGCEFEDLGDNSFFAEPQALVLTNSGAVPLFVIPPPCAFEEASVDGVVYGLGTPLWCVNAEAVNPCQALCDNQLLRKPIRVDPGASFDWSFPGYVYEDVSIPDGCRPYCEDPEINLCGIIRLVNMGALVELELLVTPECDQLMCECPMGENACDFSGEQGYAFGPTTEVLISFTHGSMDPVVVDLAGP